jgi:hypothetical protein
MCADVILRFAIPSKRTREFAVLGGHRWLVLKKKPASLFHATPERNAGAILRQGLVPRRLEHPGVGPENPFQKEPDFPVTYLADTLDDAILYAYNEYDPPTTKTVLKVRVAPDLPLYYDQTAEGAFFTTEPIPPQAISVAGVVPPL